MKFTNLVLSAVAACLLACTTLNIVGMPLDNKVEDPRTAEFIKEYKELAFIMGHTFPKQIGVSIVKIESNDGMVGGCYYIAGYRHIEIDSLYWDNIGYTKQLTVLFHELSHCYCGRDHDFNGVKYPDPHAKTEPGQPPESYYPDGCPRSILYPRVLDENCMRQHYAEYMSEMFKGCKPYGK